MKRKKNYENKSSIHILISDTQRKLINEAARESDRTPSSMIRVLLNRALRELEITNGY